MATGILYELQGVGEKEYGRLIELLQVDQNPAPGGIFHSAGPIPNGWRVFNIFESRSAFEQFYEGRLRPTFKQVGIPIPTHVDYFQIYNAYVAQPAALSALNTLGLAAATRR